MAEGATITYDSIASLVHSAEQQGSSMKCVFVCPQSGQQFESSGAIRRGTGAGDVAMQSLKRNLWYSLQRMVFQLIGSLIGRGIGGRVARDVASHTLRQTHQNIQYSQAEKEEAIARAFERIQSKFKHENGQWVAV